MGAIRYKLFILVWLLILVPSLSYAGEWRVTPIRLDFDKEAKSAVITVSNDSADKVHLQIKAMEWVQDAEGKDKYNDTSDIVYFPKIMVLEKNEEKILRAGIKTAALEKEKTYRLFIEEIPEPSKAEGAKVAIALRFGVPIFVKPQKEETKGEIEKLEMSKGGALKTVVKNSGNVHFMISSINIKGKNKAGDEIFSKELSGWYLLNGISRPYITQIPHDTCKDLERFNVEVKTKEFNLNGKLDVDTATCLP